VIRAAALGLALAACSRPAPFTVRQGPPDRAEVSPPSPPPEVRALVFADFGDRTGQQRAVAAGMASAARRGSGVQLAFSVGDNLYPCGPDPTLAGTAGCRFAADGSGVEPGFTPPPDPVFAELFEEPLADLPPVPLHVALGNHDVATWLSCPSGALGGAEVGRLKACLSVAHRSPRWTMPARHYLVDRGPIRFAVIDSNLLVGDYGGFDLEGEAAFLAEAARTRGDRLLFVVGHHPPATAGGHADEHDAAYTARVRRLEEAAGGEITAWLAGHDHDLQHLRAAAGYDVLVSGNSARGRPRERFERVEPRSARLLFASTKWGFLMLEASRTHWAVRFESDRGEPLHCCHAAPPGRCRPVACPVQR
jgi:tartrate-resistant acid phosphatase type 5